MTVQTDAPKPKLRSMPRPAIKAIAGSGFFCGLTAAFLAYFAWRTGFPFFFTGLNIFTSLFLIAGSCWMLWQLRNR